MNWGKRMNGSFTFGHDTIGWREPFARYALVGITLVVIETVRDHDGGENEVPMQYCSLLMIIALIILYGLSFLLCTWL